MRSVRPRVRLSRGDSGPEETSDQAISRLPCRMSGDFAPQRGSEGGFSHLQGVPFLIGSGASAGPQIHSGVHLPPHGYPVPGTNLNRLILSKIWANNSRGTATSAI